MRRLLYLLILFACFSCGVRAQTIASAAIKMDDVSPFGALYATIDGQEYKVADTALRFWIVQGGKAIVFSAPGSSKPSSESGQGLYFAEATKIREAETLQKRMPVPQGIYASGFRVNNVIEATSRGGKFALLVSLTDKAGIPRVVVISPQDLHTAIWDRARLAAVKDNKLTIHFFPPRGPAKMGPKDKPAFVRVFDLDEVLRTGSKQ